MTISDPVSPDVIVDVDSKMREAAQAFFAMTSSTPDAVFTKSLDGTILTWNRGAERLYGYLAADVVGQHISLLDPDPSGAEVASLLRLVAGGDSVSGYETTRRRRDGTKVAVSLTVSPLRDGRGAIIAASVIGRDISDRLALERQLAVQSTYDDITGLPNRALLDDRLAQAMARSVRRGRPVAVVFVNVDRFRAINATHGYVVGDLVLGEVATRLHATVGMGDTLARFGGDEFVVISEETRSEDVEPLVSGIARALARPMNISGLELSVTTSIGIAVSPPLISDPDAVLRYAQVAMYDAKAIGRNQWRLFDASSERRWNERSDLGRDLGSALADQLLQVHYQPIVELATGRLLGIEALLRWEHATRGWVSPALFVPLAEDTGLIAALDEWVLRHACRDAAGLRRAGILPESAYLAVNVSARNVDDPELATRVRDIAESAGLPLTALQLEVTETGVLADARSAGRVLGALREAGVGIALDDFGTGYSSLTYLRQLPISTLKVDREFVQNIAVRPDDLAIATAVVDLGRAVGVRTVAEGIETAEQLAILQRMGCLGGQGFLWSPALPLDDLSALLRAPEGFLSASPALPDRRRRARALAVTNEHGLHRIVQLHTAGASLATVAAALNAEQFLSPAGHRWHPSSVARVIADIALRQQRKQQRATT
jgi:diguanylate cyclase (GGDEF)-like protein/PAS domain S-box-containing protein